MISFFASGAGGFTRRKVKSPPKAGLLAVFSGAAPTGIAGAECQNEDHAAKYRRHMPRLPLPATALLSAGIRKTRK